MIDSLKKDLYNFTEETKNHNNKVFKEIENLKQVPKVDISKIQQELRDELSGFK